MTKKRSFRMSRPAIMALAIAFVLLFFVQAHALRFEFGALGEVGKEGNWVDTSGTHDVLQMEAEVNPNLDDVYFDLSPGQSSRYIHYATLSTNESWINEDDLKPGSVVAQVHFDNPNLTTTVDGESIGFSAWWGFTQGWNLHWNDPVHVLIDDGLVSLELSDVHYTSWFWQGPDGSKCRPGEAKVYAKVTYKSASVPDASIMFLLGPALIGLGIWGRRKR